MSEKPCVLVTGAGGALARLVIDNIKSDYNIIAIDFRNKPDYGDQIPGFRVDLVKRGFEDLFRNHKIDGVIHLGRMGAWESSNRHNRYNANVQGTRRLLDLCLKYNVGQVLILSTFYVYGAHAYNPAMLDEKSPLKASGLTLDLVDSVELENLAGIYLWKYPELNLNILRPCHIAGPGVRNSMGLLLSRKLAPVLVGFSPMMQFMHVADMADAVSTCFRQKKPGIFNVAPEDWIPYQKALEECGCMRLPLPSIPPLLPNQISTLLRWKSFPSFLINYFKYPVIIDGTLFRDTFQFTPNRDLKEVFSHYRQKKTLL